MRDSAVAELVSIWRTASFMDIVSFDRWKSQAANAKSVVRGCGRERVALFFVMAKSKPRANHRRR